MSKVGGQPVVAVVGGRDGSPSGKNLLSVLWEWCVVINSQPPCRPVDKRSPSSDRPLMWPSIGFLPAAHLVEGGRVLLRPGERLWVGGGGEGGGVSRGGQAELGDELTYDFHDYFLCSTFIKYRVTSPPPSPPLRQFAAPILYYCSRHES